MTAAHDFSKMVPGFDFLQGLVKNASSALPSLGPWVAPTLDPEELGKRIEELKTVQFWLEQNARMIGTTVQALEVQRMTLTTLKTMNVQVADLAEAFKLKDPAPAPQSAPAPTPAPAPALEAAPEAATTPTPSPAPAQAPGASGAAGPGVVDPMQWWGALTQQFTQLAAQALKDKPAVSPAATGPKSAAAAGRAAQAGAARKTTPQTARKTARKTARTSPAGQPAGGRAARRKA
jgi:hypothetical protein